MGETAVAGAGAVPGKPAEALCEACRISHDFLLASGMPIRVLEDVDPEILFMDEPFSQVDALTAESLRAEVLDIWSAKGRNPSAILMVSHDIKEVVYMADRIVVLSANPGHVLRVVENRLPRPRDYRS